MATKLFKFLLVGLVGLVLLTGCGFNLPAINPGEISRVTGSGKVVTESRTVSGFNGLVVNGAGKVMLERTGSESLSISADDNLLQYIVVEVRGGQLVIEFKPRVVFDRVTDLTFKVTVKDMNSIEVNGAAALEAKGLEAERLSVGVAGAGAVKVQGKISQQDVTLSGAAAYNAEQVEGQRATVTNSGAGVAVVRVNEQLDANISGVGVIEYIGNPQVKKNVSGIGVVRQR